MTSTRAKRGHSASVESPLASNRGSRSPSHSFQDAAANRGVAVCMTCQAKVDWNMDAIKHTWVPFDHGTETAHRCAK
jgi:hypothetical protein